MLKSLDPEKENSTCTHFNMIIECRDMEFLIRLNRDDLIDENVFVFAKIDDLDKSLEAYRQICLNLANTDEIIRLSSRARKETQ